MINYDWVGSAKTKCQGGEVESLINQFVVNQTIQCQSMDWYPYSALLSKPWVCIIYKIFCPHNIFNIVTDKVQHSYSAEQVFRNKVLNFEHPWKERPTFSGLFWLGVFLVPILFPPKKSLEKVLKQMKKEKFGPEKKSFLKTYCVCFITATAGYNNLL